MEKGYTIKIKDFAPFELNEFQELADMQYLTSRFFFFRTSRIVQELMCLADMWQYLISRIIFLRTSRIF